MAELLWWFIGVHLWRMFARQHPQEYVKNQLSWMSLDCYENTLPGHYEYLRAHPDAEDEK